MKPRRSVPSWIKDGAAVLYHPVIGRPEAHAGVVDGEPRKLCGSWVVTLRDMAPSYVEAFKRGARVVAASLEALERADLFTTAAAAPPPPERASDLHWQHRQTQDGPEWILFRGVYTIIVWPGDGFSQPKEGGRWQIREGRPGDTSMPWTCRAIGASPFFADAKLQAFDCWRKRFRDPPYEGPETETNRDAYELGRATELADVLAFLRARSADDSRAERFPSDLCDELAAALEALEHRH